MKIELAKAESQVNVLRYKPGSEKGHYESYFQRANHPQKKQAFWIRYTLFVPNGKPQEAIGELWAAFFDGETGRHLAVKKEIPLSQCELNSNHFEICLGDARLNSVGLTGAIETPTDAFSWKLSYESPQPPLFLLPLKLYSTPLPKAKSLVGSPMAVFSGSLKVNSETIDIKDWIGSQNHNWGEKHTDSYAWGQVAGFDNYPDSFLEVATAKLKIGWFETPALTPVVLRHEGKDITLNSLGQTFSADADFGFFYWNFNSENKEYKIKGYMKASADDFVGLRYYNPPGGIKHCLNSKIALCEITFTDKTTGKETVLKTRNRAAFEILTDDISHGISLRA